MGIDRIPGEGVVREQLDYVAPSELRGSYEYLFQEMKSLGLVEGFRPKLGKMLLALDGTWTIRSEKKCCDHCLSKSLSSGARLYYHSVITPCFVRPGRSEVLSLLPEAIMPQDGEEKQDCELNAAKRWLTAHGATYAPLDVAVLGDDLYAHQPFCAFVQAQQMDFIFVCKPQSHKTLYEEVELMGQNQMLQTHQFFEGQAAKRQRVELRYMNQLPIREGKDAMAVNWIEMRVFDRKDQLVYQNAFITSIPIDLHNAAAIAQAGRARWKVENENLNTLKNQGYHIEHSFGHGHRHLANTLLSLNILAFLLHTFCFLAWEKFRLIWTKVGSRKQFFQHICTLSSYMTLQSW
ncbi:MAG: ISNCY family transposase, partial [Bacteroidetes bacterium]